MHSFCLGPNVIWEGSFMEGKKIDEPLLCDPDMCKEDLQSTCKLWIFGEQLKMTRLANLTMRWSKKLTHKKVLENRISTTYPLGVESAVTLSLENSMRVQTPKDVIYFLKGMIKSFLQWPLSPFQSFSVLSPFLSCASQQDDSANPTFPHVCVYLVRFPDPLV